MSKFVLRKLIVDEACGMKLKILKPGEYTFSDMKYDDFFSDSVSIQAIVGKNGSGKSSLIEMLFRMSNNLAALMLRDYNRPAADTIYFVRDVVAELHYEIDSKPGVLKCFEDGVEIAFDNNRYVWKTDGGNCKHYRNGVLDVTEARHPQEMEAAASLFYTIATNYSLQSYIASDYLDEPLLEWKEDENDKNKTKKWLLSNSEEAWINSVFHKNDGYMSPIVLNPYRDHGIINMDGEERLTVNRLSSILWETQYDDSSTQFIEGYRLYNLVYTFKVSILAEKFSKDVLKSINDMTITGKFIKVYNQQGSYAKAVLDAYGYSLSPKMSPVEKCLRIYLVYKTFKIAEKYPTYNNFSWIGDSDNTFKTTIEPSLLKKSEELVAEITKDNSHITLKIRQTKRVIDAMTKFSDNDKRKLETPFSYGDYCKMLGISETKPTVEERLSELPPPFFKPDIFLVKNEDYDKNLIRGESRVAKMVRLENRAINLSKLSSGERQLIFMSSTLVYHALNLKSVPKESRIAYKNICMILDEIEICFHPEYQRKFIHKLLSVLRRTGVSDSFGINVLILTHSPFVLSDIPQGNIMYLAEGHQKTRDELEAEGITNPFCANINDILHQSFFLEKGFIGEFAKSRVLSLVDYLKGKTKDGLWTAEKAREFISEIGEPLLREQLLEIYKESPIAGVKDKIALYKAEIEKLRKSES